MAARKPLDIEQRCRFIDMRRASAILPMTRYVWHRCAYTPPGTEHLYLRSWLKAQLSHSEEMREAMQVRRCPADEARKVFGAQF